MKNNYTCFCAFSMGSLVEFDETHYSFGRYEVKPQTLDGSSLCWQPVTKDYVGQFTNWCLVVFPSDVPWTVSIPCEFSFVIELVRYLGFVIYDQVVSFDKSFHDMGKNHFRFSLIECLINIFCLVSVITFGVQGEKTYATRSESSPKKIKNNAISVPLAVNIWKPYTRGKSIRKYHLSWTP